MQITKSIARKAYLPLMVAVTTLAGIATAKSSANDLQTNSNAFNVTELKDVKNPFSNETAAYGTMFALGLLGTGVAASKQKKDTLYEKVINDKFTERDFSVTFNNDGSIDLVDKNNIPIGYRKYELKGYSPIEIKEIILNGIEPEYKPKHVTEKDLMKPEVKDFQEKTSTDIEFSRKSLEKKINRPMTFDANNLFDIMYGKPRAVREEIWEIYQQKGSEAFRDSHYKSIFSRTSFIKSWLSAKGVEYQEINDKNYIKDFAQKNPESVFLFSTQEIKNADEKIIDEFLNLNIEDIDETDSAEDDTISIEDCIAIQEKDEKGSEKLYILPYYAEENFLKRKMNEKINENK